MTGERVILVDHNDTPTGTAEKLAAHREGLLHRAFSVLVLDTRGHALIQRRADGKYHSAGLWSNTCCSHPRPGETTIDAARRRLNEEMGFECPLEPAGSVLYRAPVGPGLVEHEYDHLFLGTWTGTPEPDPAEVSDWRWAPLPGLRRELLHHPERFTFWFRVAVREMDDRRSLPRPDRNG